MPSAQLWKQESWESHDAECVMTADKMGQRALKMLKRFYALNLDQKETIHKWMKSFATQHINDFIYGIFMVDSNNMHQYVSANIDIYATQSANIITRFLQNIDMYHIKPSNTFKDEEDNLKFEFIRDFYDSLYCYSVMQYYFGYKVKDTSTAEEGKHHTMNIVDAKWNLIRNTIQQNRENLSRKLQKHVQIENGVFSQIGNIFKSWNASQIHKEPKQNISSLSILSTQHTHNHQYDIRHNYLIMLQRLTPLSVSESNIIFQYCSSNTFQRGYSLYHWDHFRSKAPDNCLESEPHWKWRINSLHDHDGFSVNQLFVHKKYKSIKDEILNNKIMTIANYPYKKLLYKAKQYIVTDLVKKVHSRDGDEKYNERLYDTNMTMNDLMALILFLDFTSMAEALESTFRPIYLHETLANIKLRNREFANWSKILHEVIHRFGDNKNNSCSTNNIIQYLNGSFYYICPTNSALDQFNVRITSPFIATKNVNVAITNLLQYPHGMVLELDNKDNNNRQNLRALPCSWLRNNKARNELLFIGGRIKMQIVSVHYMQKKVIFSYERYVRALYLLDFILSGTSLYRMCNTGIIDISDDNYNSIKDFVHGTIDKYPSFIKDSFYALRQNKKMIVFNYCNLFGNYYKYFERLKDLMLTEEKLPDDFIFREFPSVGYYIIYATIFDLLLFLKLIEKYRERMRDDVEIRIIAKHCYSSGWRTMKRKWHSKSWIAEAMNKHIEGQFKNKLWNINLNTTDEKKIAQYDILFITKLM